MDTSIFQMNNSLVIGGAGGIGSSIVSMLNENHIPTVVIDNNKLALDKLHNAIPDIKVIICDLSKPKELRKAIAKLNMINTIIHCAGYGGPFKDIEHTTYLNWQKAFAVNVNSLFIINQELLPHMRSRQFGRIVAISSIQGQLGSWGSSAYVSSKHALNGYIRTLASEYGKIGITANAISPGYISSPMGANNEKVNDYTSMVLSRTPTASVGTPSQISELVKVLIREDMEYMNGAILTLDGGISASVGVL